MIEQSKFAQVDSVEISEQNTKQGGRNGVSVIGANIVSSPWLHCMS